MATEDYTLNQKFSGVGEFLYILHHVDELLASIRAKEAGFDGVAEDQAAALGMLFRLIAGPREVDSKPPSKESEQ